MQAYTLTSGTHTANTYASKDAIVEAMLDGTLTKADGLALLDAFGKATPGSARDAEIRVYAAGEGRLADDGGPARANADGSPMFPLGAPRVDLALPKGAKAFTVVSLTPADWGRLAAMLPSVLAVVAGDTAVTVA